MTFDIRRARIEDAADISRVILTALRETNAKDYAPDIIDRVAASFDPSSIESLMNDREMYVALLGHEVVGTASLHGQTVSTMFVAPAVHGRGIGRLLMAAVEQAARRQQIDALLVQATVTAEGFYTALGFKSLRDSYHGAERTIIMERRLSAM